jgi:hypothetical protein
MISHRYKCIFVHIHRTAGTSIENWIVGNDWWKIEASTKHLLASQAKKVYSKYWDNYFKFAFVRNPWDRMISCLNYPTFYGITYNDRLNFDKYKTLLGYPITIENDYRFSKRDELITKKHQNNAIYSNILDEKLNFIGSFESLQKDIQFIKNKLKIKKDFQFQNKILASNRSGGYRDYYDEKSQKVVEDLYKRDIKNFHYEF